MFKVADSVGAEKAAPLKANHRPCSRTMVRSYSAKAPTCKNPNSLERRQTELKKLPKAFPAQKQAPCMFSKIQPPKCRTPTTIAMTEREPGPISR